jgi:hypothetical protein
MACFGLFFLQTQGVCKPLRMFMCLCSTSCQHVNIQITATSYVITNLCVPNNLNSAAYAHPLWQPPAVHPPPSTPRATRTNSEQDITLTVARDTAIIADGLQPLECSADADCFDLSAYTTDTCQHGVCTYSTQKENITTQEQQQQSEELTLTLALASSHGTTHSHIRERITPFTHVWFHPSAQSPAQSAFEDRMQQDNYPVEYFTLNFSFPCFGTTISEVSVNLN